MMTEAYGSGEVMIIGNDAPITRTGTEPEVHQVAKPSASYTSDRNNGPTLENAAATVIAYVGIVRPDTAVALMGRAHREPATTRLARALKDADLEGKVLDGVSKVLHDLLNPGSHGAAVTGSLKMFEGVLGVLDREGGADFNALHGASQQSPSSMAPNIGSFESALQ